MRYLLFFVSIYNILFAPLTAITEQDVPIIPCAINKANNRKATMAICAIFRDEADFLKEWIEFHRLVGVDHFYLYNNYSQDRFWEVLAPYVDKGIVELFDVPFDSYACKDNANTHNFVQVCCYNHALNLSKGYNRWLGVIDVDEFITPCIDATIPKALARYGNIGGIAVFWQMYGTSNVWDLQPGELMIEKLVLKQPNPSKGLFKSIVRPKYAEICRDPHWVRCEKMVLPDGRRFSHTARFDALPIDVIRINHYTFRTRKFYETVKRPRREKWGYVLPDDQVESMLNSYNIEYDPVMLRFVPQLKKRMEKL